MASYNNEQYFEALRLKAEARSSKIRQKDAERKRQERALMSLEQKEALKEKARCQYHNKKAKYDHDDDMVLPTISSSITTAVNLADVSTTPTASSTTTITAEEELATKTLVIAAAVVAEPSYYAGT